MFRRFFGGEERSEQEARQETEKTEQSLQKTRQGIFGGISRLFRSDSNDPITPELWEQLEELLIQGDVGVELSSEIVEEVREKCERQGLRLAREARALLKKELVKLLRQGNEAASYSPRSTKPYVILVVGVNGVGKTTLIAKVTQRYKQVDKFRVILAAADTFRAAAIEQLQSWGERVGATVIATKQGGDPGAIAYEATEYVYAREKTDDKYDILIIDTAGRLQAKHNLMKELEKIRNVVKKRWQYAPHEVLLVIDATTGQNGLLQAKAFAEVVDVTHIALTKLDSTAKGGIAFSIVEELERPIKYIGTGEKPTDLALFDPEAFVDALFEEDRSR